MTARTIDVTKRFGDVTAVDGVSFEVSPGEIVGLLGANGAGKTTVMRLLLGLLEPTAGGVELFGRAPSRAGVRRVGYVPQGLGLYSDLTAADNMAFQAGVFGFEPADPDPDLAVWWEVPVERMPLGVRRRVAFAVALAHGPEMLVLDEPTSGVGPLGRARLWDMIRRESEGGAGVLVSTHHLEEAEQCDRLVMMAAGSVVAEGSLGEIVAGHDAVEVTVGDWPAAFDALHAAGQPVSLVGNRLRVASGDLPSVESTLRSAGIDGEVSLTTASLEETFVRLSA